MKNRMNKRWRAEHLYSKNRRTPGNIKGSNQINNLAVKLYGYVRQTLKDFSTKERPANWPYENAIIAPTAAEKQKHMEACFKYLRTNKNKPNLLGGV